MSYGIQGGSFDKATRASTIIGYSHHEIHSGSHFYIEGYTTLGNDPGVDDTLYVKLVTPNTTKWAHFLWSINSSGILVTTLHEDASGGMTGGSGVTPLNSNRNSSKASGITITSGVTVQTTPGTLVSRASWGAEGFKSQIGGGQSRDDEIILKQNTIYLRASTSSSAANIVQFKASWYEHTDKT